MNEIKIKNDYGNGSYSYFSERFQRQLNIRPELGAAILKLQRKVREMTTEINKLHDELLEDRP